MPELRALLEARTATAVGFAADGATAYVLSDLTGTLQLYRVPVAGGTLEQLTDLGEPVTAYPIPRRQELVVSLDEGGDEREQLYLHSGEPGAGLRPLVVEPELLHRNPRLSRDGALLAYACNRRNRVDVDVYVRSLDAGRETCVFDRGGMCHAAGFSPDARLFAVIRPTDRSSDEELWLVDVRSGEAQHVTPHEEEAEYGDPQWLPDGSAFLCATNEGRDNIAIRRYDLAARAWTMVLESRWDLRCWIDDLGRTLLVEENADGYSRLELREPRTLELRRELQLPGSGVLGMPYEEPRFSPDGRLLAYQFTSPCVPGDVWIAEVATGETRRLTRSPHDLEETELHEPALRRFSSFDGESIPVFVFEPAFAEERPPVVFVIHGGPEAQLRPTWSPLTQFFVSHGFAVAAPNVRGSTGYGKRYEHLDDVERRLDSVRDLVALHEELSDAGRLDMGRAVLYGGSYGGYMVLAGLAFHPERWAAGIEIVGISSLVSFLENTSEWRRAFREREYGALDRDRDFLLEASPLTHVDDIRAPLFVIHGANDPRVPVGEAQQIHRSLTERGIRCDLLVYDDEGHGLQKLKNKLDAYPRAVAFLQEVLSAVPACGRVGVS
jgi:dipeptidyl aminopeptidase/acylaminoacyl peptidase